MNNSAAVELTGKLTVVALIILFLVVLFLLFLHFYAKWFYYLRQEESFTITTTNTRRFFRRRRRFDFAANSIEEGTAGTGLDPSVLKSIPTLVFDPRNCKAGIDCAVCLSDLAAGEEARMLPKCNHAFHANCIDTWFRSHSTCPICRNQVSIPTQLPESSTEGGFPANVLFYGDRTEICRVGVLGLEEDDSLANCVPPQKLPICCSSSSSAQSLVIDIPAKANDDEETKLPATTPRVRPMKRLLSRDKRLNPCINVVDTEQIDQVQS